MAKQTVNIGSAANDGTGDTHRAAFDKLNQNDNEIYAAIGDGTTLDLVAAINTDIGSSVWQTGNVDVPVQDDASEIVAAPTALNFAGAGVVVTDVAGVATITIASGSGAIPAQDDGVEIVAAPTALNFTGAGVSVTDVGGVATIAVAGGSGGIVNAKNSSVLIYIKVDNVLGTANPASPLLTGNFDPFDTIYNAFDWIADNYNAAGDVFIEMVPGQTHIFSSGLYPPANIERLTLDGDNGATCVLDFAGNGSITTQAYQILELVDVIIDDPRGWDTGTLKTFDVTFNLDQSNIDRMYIMGNTDINQKTNVSFIQNTTINYVCRNTLPAAAEGVLQFRGSGLKIKESFTFTVSEGAVGGTNGPGRPLLSFNGGDGLQTDTDAVINVQDLAAGVATPGEFFFFNGAGYFPSSTQTVTNGIFTLDDTATAIQSDLGIATQDDGVEIVAAARAHNFTGAGVSVTDVGGVATIAIAGGGGGAIPVQDDAVEIVASPTAHNFTGSGVTVTDVGGVATINVPGGSAGFNNPVELITLHIDADGNPNGGAPGNLGTSGSPFDTIFSAFAHVYETYSQVSFLELEFLDGTHTISGNIIIPDIVTDVQFYSFTNTLGNAILEFDNGARRLYSNPSQSINIDAIRWNGMTDLTIHAGSLFGCELNFISGAEFNIRGSGRYIGFGTAGAPYIIQNATINYVNNSTQDWALKVSEGARVEFRGTNSVVRTTTGGGVNNTIGVIWADGGYLSAEVGATITVTDITGGAGNGVITAGNNGIINLTDGTWNANRVLGNTESALKEDLSPVTTVAGLTAAATAGAGARSFVTDANATTFNSVVAAGGANGVPVFSDGTDWRIG